ncbi:MAG: DUF4926 domain-containing protein [Candidatus Sumerlaeia bacterium]|nr:DUF4926 domain-containing protein [Candidatus Sumerlaeia bacterium]
MIQEHNHVVLLTSVSAHGLVPGDVGTVVHIHNAGEGYEVEFMDVFGETIAVVTVDSKDLRALQEGERVIPHLHHA